MRILALDPGSAKSAWVLLKDGVPIEFAIDDNESILDFVVKPLDDCHRTIEMMKARGMPTANEELMTCVWIGRFMQASGHPWTFVYRQDVKLHLCGRVTASDANIRCALIDRYGGKDTAIGGVKCKYCKGKGWYGNGRPTCPVCKGEKWLHPPGPLHGLHADLWQALAVAVTFVDQQEATS